MECVRKNLKGISKLISLIILTIPGYFTKYVAIFYSLQDEAMAEDALNLSRNYIAVEKIRS